MARMKFRRTLWLSLGLLLAVSLAACDNTTSCGSGSTGNSARTEGANEFKCWESTVRTGPADGAALSAFSGTGWHDLDEGDALSTDENGEAELNLAACWDGRLYVFQNSSHLFQVAECRRRDIGSVSCVPDGSIYVGGCAAAYSVDTGSARITVSGTTYGLTYLPQSREITLVVALEGAVQVEPVEDVAANRLGGSIVLPPEMFLFTMPNRLLADIDGIPPRDPRPLDELPVVVNALGLQVQEWLQGIRVQAQRDGVLPASWPTELGGQAQETPTPIEPGQAPGGLVIFYGGGPLDDSRVQRAVLAAVDWPSAVSNLLEPDQTVTAVVDDEPTDVLERIPYDPELAAALLDEAGYVAEGADPEFQVRFSMQLVYVREDQEMAGVAATAAEFLSSIGVASRLRPLPEADFEERVTGLIQSGQPTMTLEQRVQVRFQGFDRRPEIDQSQGFDRG